MSFCVRNVDFSAHLKLYRTSAAKWTFRTQNDTNKANFRYTADKNDFSLDFWYLVLFYIKKDAQFYFNIRLSLLLNKQVLLGGKPSGAWLWVHVCTIMWYFNTEDLRPNHVSAKQIHVVVRFALFSCAIRLLSCYAGVHTLAYMCF